MSDSGDANRLEREISTAMASPKTYAVAETPLVFAAALVAMAVGRALTSGSLDAWYVDALHDADASATMRRGLSRGAAADAAGLAVGAVAGGFLPYAFDGLDHRGDGILFYTPVTLIAAATAFVYLAVVGWLVVEERGAPGGPSLRARVEDVTRATRTALVSWATTASCSGSSSPVRWRSSHSAR